MRARWIYMTASTREEALRIGRALVEEGLAACCNLLGETTSIYRWKGEIHEDPEVAFIAKTTADLLPALTERVASLHSYECPCVVALPIDGGYGPFLDWLADATRA